MNTDLYPVLGTGLSAVACTCLALMGIHGLIGPARIDQGYSRPLGLSQLGLALMLTGEPARACGLVLAMAGIGLAIWSFNRRGPGRLVSHRGAAPCAAC